MFIDGDFPTGAQCEHHCSPTCHPAQVDQGDWHYGCLHDAWPQNRTGDFCPIVECGGDPAKCEIPARMVKNMLNGKRRRLSNLRRKIDEVDVEIEGLEKFLYAKWDKRETDHAE